MTIGIDIGGTKTAVGLFDGNVLVTSEITPTGSFDATMDGIAAIGSQWTRDAKITAVGIACSGPLDIPGGVVMNSATLDGWYGKPIGSIVRRIFSAPVTLLNDADAALVGEIFDGGNGLGETNPALMLTFGTGVGGAFWDGANVYSGAFGEHPEIGHLGIDPHGPECYCGLNGCLESLTSGTALDGFAQAAGLGGIEELGAAADGGNQAALDLLGRTRAAITYGLISLTHTFRPAAFILGGGVMEKLHRFLAPAEVPVQPSAVPGPAPLVLLASLGNRAGMVGASVAARRAASPAP